MTPRAFASDNNAGVHPEVLAAIAAANTAHARSYGHDPLTEQAREVFRSHFGPAADAWFVFNGTAANVLGLAAVARPHEAVICTDSAHIHVDECGAPERFTGCKLIPVRCPDGKLRPADLPPLLRGIGDEHRVQPRVVSITQATELGTVYTAAEIRALADAAHAHGLLLHLDGARLANAAVSLGLPLRALTTDAGVDLLSFGGTKNGLLGAEAIVFPQGAGGDAMAFIRKQGMQLASKMRFLAAQLIALLGGDLWQRNAGHANRMARLLAEQVQGVPGITLTQPVEANGVFARVPPEHIPALQERAFFYVWNPETSEVRWMTAWDTTEQDVVTFARAVREIVR
ncbi:MAG: beta-eliminating lyase-related protein [Gemmatimonadota bacterium]|nr:beta-eliminating lyase-related protein [Gemmatimonadota bacterium]